MKRIIMMVFRNLFLVPYMWIRLCYHASHVDKYKEEQHYELLKYITHRANKGGNVTIDAYGVENIPDENGFMFFPNHQGLYDVLAILDACPIPQVIINVTNEVKKGRNYLIFPEGTRSKNGNELLEFKGGSFKAATKAKCPIIPVALIDSFKPFDTNTTSQVTVQVHFLKPLYYEDYKDMNTKEIAALVRERIQSTIREAGF